MSGERWLIAGQSPYEAQVGYSRAVRVGGFIFVSGTTGSGANAYEQTTAAIQGIARALAEAGATLEDVVRTRMFVTTIADWPQIGRAHSEAFAHIRPATSMLEVARLIAPEMLVEIEADAFVG